MRKKDEERVKRYRLAYPFDKHADAEILAELNEVKKEKKYINYWIRKAGWLQPSLEE